MTADDDVLFQGKWIPLYEDGSYWMDEEVVKQIQENHPDPDKLFGKPIVIEDSREHPGNCHNGQSNAGKIASYWVDHTNQCPATRAAIKSQGLTRNGACPTIRNPKKERT